MLEVTRRGYAVMSKDLKSYSFDHPELDKCIKYCYKDNVVVERIPYVVGFSLRFTWGNFEKVFEWNRYWKNILWLHISFSKEYSHKNGKIVHKN